MQTVGPIKKAGGVKPDSTDGFSVDAGPGDRRVISTRQLSQNLCHVLTDLSVAVFDLAGHFALLKSATSGPLGTRHLVIKKPNRPLGDPVSTHFTTRRI